MNQKQTVVILSVCARAKLLGLYAFDNPAAAVKAWEVATEMDALIAAVKTEQPHMTDEDARQAARKRVDLGHLSGTELWEVEIDSDLSEIEAGYIRKMVAEDVGLGPVGRTMTDTDTRR